MPEQPARILVFSEHQDSLDFLIENLDKMGHQVSSAVSEAEVLNAVKCDEDYGPNFDLLLLDANRPELLKEVRNHQMYRDIPIMALIAEDEMHLAEQCIALGARDYLRDPLNPLLLKVRVNAGLEEKFARDRARELASLLKIEHDLQVAQQIQLSFLSSELPDFEGWEVASRFYPARTVAGDWYDAFYLANRRRLGVVIADVCDKGLPSALFMALCRSLVRAFAQQNYSMRWADDALSRLETSDVADRNLRRPLPSAGTIALKTAVQLTNSYILENHAQANMFATLFFGVIDPASGGLSYVNAGHNPPFIVSKDGKVKERLKPTGPAVGIFPEADFGIMQADLQPGDILVTFTDGVPDTHSPDGKLYTEKRLTELVSAPAPSAKDMLDRIDEAIHDHMGDAIQFDDITMIAVRYKLPGEA